MIQRTELLGEDCRLTALGIQLRDAREAMGLSDVDAAERLYISVAHVRAMEEARYELMPAEVFARGYLRSYARLLNLDPEEVLRRYRPERPAPIPEEEAPVVPQQPAPQQLLAAMRQWLGQWPDRAVFIASGAAIALVLVGVIVALVMGREDAGGAASAADRQAEAVVVNPELFRLVESASALGVTLPQTGDAGDAGPAGATKSLEIRFSGDSWVEVRDSSRKILLADMRRAGDREVVLGEPPYKVVLGKSEAVAIRYQGRWIDIEPQTGKNHAQVVIGG